MMPSHKTNCSKIHEPIKDLYSIRQASGLANLKQIAMHVQKRYVWQDGEICQVWDKATG
jgi:hypothetical protein